MTFDLPARVDKGVQFLNVHYPGWHTKITLNDLNLAYAHSCVLGQLFGGYFGGLKRLGISFPMSDSLGFSLPDGLDDLYPQLTEEWEEAISHLNR